MTHKKEGKEREVKKVAPDRSLERGWKKKAIFRRTEKKQKEKKRSTIPGPASEKKRMARHALSYREES